MQDSPLMVFWQQNMIAIVVALVLLVAVIAAVWLRAKKASARERYRAPDALDEGAAPARRNQALIDAPSATAAALASTGPGIMGGIGEVVAAAAAQEVRSAEEARAVAALEEAEADAAVPESVSAPVSAPEVVPVSAPEPEVAPVADAAPDNLTRIKGLGPKLSAKLNTLGVTRFDQIAAWTAADIARIDAELGSFAGRPTRDRWVEQAGYLASGDVAGYEAAFGKV